MENKIHNSTLVIFWILLASFVLAITNIFIMNLVDLFNRYVFFASMVLLPCLGIALIVLVTRANFTRISKAFFILTGASAIGMGISIILHNLVYALFIKIFGEGFWAGGDEPVFFIFATIVCPLALFVGIIGSIVLIARKGVISQ